MKQPNEVEFGKAMILVTGAAGFIGRALCLELSRSRRLVRAVTRSFAHLHGISAEVYVGEVGSTTEWGSALVGVDTVIHLAGLAHAPPKMQLNNQGIYREVNALGAARIAEQAAAKGVSRFVYLSTAKVCGEITHNRPFDETDVSDSMDPYIASKREAEKLLRDIAAKTGMEVVIIRPPLVYGPGVKANFQNMMLWLCRGVPLPLGNIHNRRSLVALDNLVDFICVCLNHPKAANQTFLVSDGDDISTTELLRQLARALNVPARLVPVPQALLVVVAKVIGRGDLSQRLCASLQLDISKAHALLGWRPPVTMEAVLSPTAEYFSSNVQRQGEDCRQVVGP